MNKNQVFNISRSNYDWLTHHPYKTRWTSSDWMLPDDDSDDGRWYSRYNYLNHLGREYDVRVDDLSLDLIKSLYISNESAEEINQDEFLLVLNG